MTTLFSSFFFSSLFLCCALWFSQVSQIGCSVGYKIAEAQNFKLIGSSGQSFLYEVIVPGSPYEDPILLIDLHGSRHQIGYDYGKLLGKRAYDNYNTFIGNLIGTSWEARLLISVLESALDWQWNDYLSKQVPSEYLEEIKGLGEGSKAVGLPDISQIVGRMVTLANAPGDVKDFAYILLREFENRVGPFPKAVWEQLNRLTRNEKPAGLQCSMFAVWGDRTQNGDLLSARNLDWNKDTGIQKNKLIAIYHPNDTSIPHLTLGYVGLAGALTGMSKAGLTVHEANLEENEITFDGFPWLLRLRYIMENAHNIQEARALWEKTNNTVGFNHMIASGYDAKSGNHPAMVEETMYQYTAYFYDDDKREQDATYTDSNGKKEQIGFPMKQALWRTNHGYDPTIRKHFEWSQSPTSWSMQRYMFIHNGFEYYENSNIKIGELEAINITAIAGDKGRTAYQCQDSTAGSNVLSATYHPTSNIMYAAWENGHGNSWRPACCNTYVKFDLNKWWQYFSFI